MTRREALSLVLASTGALVLSACNVLEPPKPLPLDEETTRRLVQIAQAHPKVQAAATALRQQGFEADWARTSGSKVNWLLNKLVALGVFTNDPNRFFMLAFRDDTLGIARQSEERNPLVMAALIQVVNPAPDTYDFILTDLLAGKATVVSVDPQTKEVRSITSGRVVSETSLEGLSTPVLSVRSLTTCKVPESLIRNLDVARAEEARTYALVAVATAGVTTSKLGLAGCVIPTAPVSCPAGLAALAGALGTLAMAAWEARIAQQAREVAELAIEEWKRDNCR